MRHLQSSLFCEWCALWRRLAAVRAGWLASACVGLVWCAVGTGCGKQGATVYRVSGVVTLQGQPVPVGQIYFEPDTKAGNRGPMGSAEIIDGRFDTSARGRVVRGRGVIGGPHVIHVIASQPGPQSVPSTDDAPSGKILFDGIVTRLDLPRAASVQEFEVPSSNVAKRK